MEEITRMIESTNKKSRSRKKRNSVNKKKTKKKGLVGTVMGYFSL